MEKEEDPDIISMRDHFNCTQTCRRQKRKQGIKKKIPLASRPKNVSNELTDHIPTHKSQSQNHIQTYNSSGRKRERARCGTPECEKGGPSDRPNEHPPSTSHDATPQMVLKLFHAAKSFSLRWKKEKK